MSSGGQEGAVYAEREVLTADYCPSPFRFRDAERRAVRTALSPTVASGGTGCVLVCGPPAAGKRTTVDVTCRELASGPGGTDLDLVPVACPTDATAYQLAIATTNALGPDEDVAESGYSRETAFRRLRGRIEAVDGTPILRFDGAHRVDPAEIAVLLAGLLDAPGDLDCGIVVVADGLAYRNALGVATRRRMDREVFVGPYDADQRRSILEERVETAFQPGTCPEVVVDRCLSAAESSDAPLRTALELLRLAGDAAVADGAETIATEHVDRAESAVHRDRLTESLAALSAHERRTLAAVATVEDGRFESIYDDYRRRCRAADVSPNRERSVHNYLDALTSADLIEATEARSAAGGRYFEYALGPDRAVIEDAFAALDGVAFDVGSGRAR